MLHIEHDLSEKDRHGICRVRIPLDAHLSVGVGDPVALHDPSERAVTGVITEINRIAWIARVKVDD